MKYLTPLLRSHLDQSSAMESPFCEYCEYPRATYHIFGKWACYACYRGFEEAYKGVENGQLTNNDQD